MENLHIDWVWVWVWYGESLTFTIGYGDDYIPTIILVSAIFLSPFKLLKYS